jgi:DNA-binding GntR family transcriptional regulator
MVSPPMISARPSNVWRVEVDMTAGINITSLVMRVCGPVIGYFGLGMFKSARLWPSCLSMQPAAGHSRSSRRYPRFESVAEKPVEIIDSEPMSKANPKPKPYILLQHIRTAIVEGRYLPGQSLREEALEAEFQVSRGPIREALRLLELRGLVTHIPRRGFRVRTYSRTTVENLYRLRAKLERGAVESLQGREIGDLVLATKASNERMSAFFESGDVASYLVENNTFHSLILEASDNEPLTRTLSILSEMAEPLRYRILRRNMAGSRSLVEHRRIADYLAQGQIELAAAVMEGHILFSLPVALAALKEIVDISPPLD